MLDPRRRFSALAGKALNSEQGADMLPPASDIALVSGDIQEEADRKQKANKQN